VAGRATNARNHALNCTPGTVNMVGRRAEDNPVRMDLEEAAGMPFVRFFADAQDAITEARRLFPAHADVLVFPSGGITYPEIGAAT